MNLMSEKDDKLSVVAIGASAGGLEALFHFFSHVPTDLGVAFIIIRHLKRDFKSSQDELLKKYTDLPIENIKGGEKVTKNKIFVLPENKKLEVKDKVLYVSERKAQEIINTQINDFFYSLADDFKERAIGIIMSGTGTDGTKGAYAIEENGGIIMVQDPQ